MRPQKQAQHWDPKIETSVSGSEPGDARHQEQLSERQVLVLSCLRAAQGALTMRQLEARTKYAGAELLDALDALLKRDLVARLNTLIPSYVSRHPDAGLSAE